MFYSAKNNTYINVPEKCGVESIILLIASENNFSNHHLIWNHLGKIRSSHNHDNFNRSIGIVRNPYSRLVSGYVDKFLTGNFSSAFPQRVSVAIGGKRPTFRELVDFLSTVDINKIDPHFKSQSASTPNIPRGNIFKLENIDQIKAKLKDLGFETKFINYRNKWLYSHEKKHITGAFDMSYQDFDIAEKRNNPVSILCMDGKHGVLTECPYAKGIGFHNAVIPDTESFYNKEIKEKVYKIYKNDFDRFEY